MPGFLPLPAVRYQGWCIIPIIFLTFLGGGKVILSCKGMYFLSAAPLPPPLSPECCILFWDEEVFQLHWYIIAANHNHCLQTVSGDQFRPHTLLWPWHLRKINPTLSLRRELTRRDYRRNLFMGSAIPLCWSIGEEVFDGFRASRPALLLAGATLTPPQTRRTFESDDRNQSVERGALSNHSPLGELPITATASPVHMARRQSAMEAAAKQQPKVPPPPKGEASRLSSTPPEERLPCPPSHAEPKHLDDGHVSAMIQRLKGWRLFAR